MNKNLEELNIKLQTIFEDRQQNKKIGERIKVVNDKIAKLHKTAQQRKKKLSKERKDFERVEKYNTSKLFTTILGDREKQLEKERQEYLQSALEYNAVIDEIELLEFEKEVIDPKFKNTEIIETNLQNLIQEKEALLLKFNPEAAKKLRYFDDEILSQRLLNKEIGEAIIIGKYCSSLLNETYSNLNLVKNWGYNRGMVNNYTKRAKIEKARILISNTKVNLDKFSKEVSDVYSNINIKFRLENFDNFISVFFDNLITDWIIQSKIHNALNNITAVNDKVNRIMSNLKSDNQSALVTIDKLLKSKEEYVVKL